MKMFRKIYENLVRVKFIDDISGKLTAFDLSKQKSVCYICFGQPQIMPVSTFYIILVFIKYFEVI